MPPICICFHRAEGVSGWGKCQKNSELRDREDVCILSDRRRASERERRGEELGEGAGVGGREERRRVSRTERVREE